MSGGSACCLGQAKILEDHRSRLGSLHSCGLFEYFCLLHGVPGQLREGHPYVRLLLPTRVTEHFPLCGNGHRQKISSSSRQGRSSGAYYSHLIQELKCESSLLRFHWRIELPPSAGLKCKLGDLAMIVLHTDASNGRDETPQGRLVPR